MAINDAAISALPEPFNFYRLVLDTDHLHFGFWPDDSPDLTLEEAQEQMFNRLSAYLPKPPADVLDVGCGLGLSAYLLSKGGYKITAIAPSQALIDYASKHYGDGNIAFINLGFLEKNTSVFKEQSFDVILFQESLQYLHPLDMVFRKASLLLKAGGSVIIGDEICHDKSVKGETSVHLREDIITTLFENRFRITKDLEIGKNVIRTCDNIINRFTENFQKIISSVDNETTENNLKFFLKGWKSQKKWYTKNSMGYAIIIAKKDEISIRQYSDGDEKNILILFNRIFKTNRTIEHWYWKFRDNPFGVYKIAEATNIHGDLVAHYCGYPIPFFSSAGNSREFLSFQAGDTMTSPNARSSGLGKTSTLTRTAIYFYNKFCSDNIPFIYGFNTGTIRKFGEKFLGYEYISLISCYVMTVNKKNSSVLDKIKILFSGLSVETSADLSDEYDFFFNKVCTDYGTLVQRKARYLKWRYLDCPDKIHRFFAVRRSGQLVGWSVFVVKGDVLLWGDALFDKKYIQAADFMLHHVLKHFYPNIKRVEGWFSPVPVWWSDTLKQIGFEPKDEPNKLAPTFRFFDDKFSREFLEENFYYTMGDSDLF